MKTIPQLQLTRALRLRGTFLAVFAGCFAAGLAATHAAPPSLRPLVQPGKWPALPRGGGEARDVKVVGHFAYLALARGGLAVIDVSNPADCVRVGGYDTTGLAYRVAVVAGRIYVADWEAGLLVLPTLPNVQFTVRVNATTNLNTPIPWTPLLTTNVPVMPFDFVDFDVKLSEKPQKYYRVRQP